MTKDVNESGDSWLIGDVEFRKLTPNIGVEVTGIDLAQSLDAEILEALRSALVSQGVIFFRDQNLSTDQQVELSRRFGHVPKVPDGPFLVHEDNPFVSVLANDENRPPTVNNWHSDNTFYREPDFASVLYAAELPETGGDTVWSSTDAAYQGLSAGMQRYLDGLTAVHDFMKLYERPVKSILWEGEREQLMRKQAEDHPPVRHPVIRTHPETGRKTIFVNRSFTRHIVELSEAESRHILEFLFEHVEIPEYQVRFNWRQGSVAIWDNRCTQHYAVADYYPRVRRMHRVTVLENPRDQD